MAGHQDGDGGQIAEVDVDGLIEVARRPADGSGGEGEVAEEEDEEGTVQADRRHQDGAVDPEGREERKADASEHDEGPGHPPPWLSCAVAVALPIRTVGAGPSIQGRSA